MTEETKALLGTLSFTIDLISRGTDADRHRVTLAYQEAQILIASIAHDNGDARPRILACIERYDAYKAANDIACAGWMLAAIHERANERNLDGWEIVQAAVNKAVELLPSPDGTIH